MTPDLTGRVARCVYGCGRSAPSDPGLAFFAYLGPGNDRLTCAVCGYHPNVHTATPDHIARRPTWQPHEWVRLVREHDEYYCGCRGWD